MVASKVRMAVSFGSSRKTTRALQRQPLATRDPNPVDTRSNPLLMDAIRLTILWPLYLQPSTVTPPACFLHPHNPPNPYRSHHHTDGPRGSVKGHFARTLRWVTLKDPFFNGREAVIESLTRQWEKEMD
ncbi:hypothetical protein BS47DRAFT_1392827 [Hydnum rufescens UP504]|uniref:Uncharacterized protein n=1 Tax=Hydnum rufescens UP504 TaxID=1448309 RepID=A0A9P6AXP6_9AGAM|nr:hypothetical protein BS47DRAFT_1392827 [Hydnum rufescens UP504]